MKCPFLRPARDTGVTDEQRAVLRPDGGGRAASLVIESRVSSHDIPYGSSFNVQGVGGEGLRSQVSGLRAWGLGLRACG